MDRLKIAQMSPKIGFLFCAMDQSEEEHVSHFCGIFLHSVEVEIPLALLPARAPDFRQIKQPWPQVQVSTGQ